MLMAHNLLRYCTIISTNDRFIYILSSVLRNAYYVRYFLPRFGPETLGKTIITRTSRGGVTIPVSALYERSQHAVTYYFRINIYRVDGDRVVKICSY